MRLIVDAGLLFLLGAFNDKATMVGSTEIITRIYIMCADVKINYKI